ncbi:MAG: IS3 family transposase [Candidatus Magasanikbacteria bacterium]|nr:IS3 family transposase [Candidatus Magasanikbacteria bacterium]
MAKKNFTFLTHQEKRMLINKNNGKISITRQAELLDVSRSSVYYAPRIDPDGLRKLSLLDRLYTKYPFYGSRRLRFALDDEYHILIGREQTRRLMRILGIEAIFPKHQTTITAPGHKIYPYLLRNLLITHPNQVWSTDITYIPLNNGFCYLTVILDWFSRYVLAWELSENMETAFCARALKSALARAMPEIHNSDQGSQFTSMEYTDILEASQIKISMDGRGRCLDNIFTERLWRTVKYEDIYLKHYCTIQETYDGLQNYFPFYNQKRRHQSLNYKTPEMVYQN